MQCLWPETRLLYNSPRSFRKALPRFILGTHAHWSSIMASQNRRKRPREDFGEQADPVLIRHRRAAFLSSITRSISPPRKAWADPSQLVADDHSFLKSNDVQEHVETEISISHSDFPEPRSNLSWNTASKAANPVSTSRAETSDVETRSSQIHKSKIIPSPFKLTRIRDLSPEANKDTIALHEILGDPLIKEAWVFNFCFDIDWMMQHFDSDVRDLVQVKVVHGSWRQEDGNKINIDDACRRWTNVQSITAYLPDAFGTHHSKLFVLFTHDDRAEIVIHTANMLARDWTNMTQAVWRSPSLSKSKNDEQVPLGPIGSGSRFKHDFLAYLKSYGGKLKGLVNQLQDFDFNDIKGALVASVPSKVNVSTKVDENSTSIWGYPRLRQVLEAVSKRSNNNTEAKKDNRQHHLVCQASSIATLPRGWLDEFLKSSTRDSPLSSTKNLSIIFPTATNVRNSLDGYAAGISIHTKAQSKTHLQQINSLRPYLHQWTRGPLKFYRSRRDLAAPHIKTYIEFDSKPSQENPTPNINWALLTSANLSTQAWGSLPKIIKESKDKQDLYVHIQSFEIGVLVWPGLFEDSSSDSFKSCPTRMIPVFGQNEPNHDLPEKKKKEEEGIEIGMRMSYDLPLTLYERDELPWSPQGEYQIKDRHGNIWPPSRA